MINYKKGNLFDNLSKDKKNVILHVCNDAGGWGSGFVVAINDNLGLIPRQKYQQWCQRHEIRVNGKMIPFKLGQIQVAPTDDTNTFVVNMIGQSQPGGHTFSVGDEEVYYPPFRPDSFRECMYRVVQLCEGKNLNIICPLMGCGLAGSTKDVVFGIVQEVVGDILDITVYEI